MRAFLAIPLPSATRQVLDDACRAFIDTDPSWAEEKWVTPDRLHVTLGFFKDLDEASTGPLLDGLARACSTIESFHTRIGRLAPRPKAASARMLWVGFAEGLTAFRHLHSEIRPAIEVHGANPGRRDLHPHVTLVRARRPRPATSGSIQRADKVLSSADPSSLRVSVSDVILFRSELRPEGPVYSPIGSAMLRSD